MNNVERMKEKRQMQNKEENEKRKKRIHMRKERK